MGCNGWHREVYGPILSLSTFVIFAAVVRPDRAAIPETDTDQENGDVEGDRRIRGPRGWPRHVGFQVVWEIVDVDHDAHGFEWCVLFAMRSRFRLLPGRDVLLFGVGIAF